MINANELRIGNYILHDNNFIEVFEIPYLIDIDENKEGYLVNSVWLSECSPMPITTEILEKFGFVSNPYRDRYEYHDIHVEYCGFRNILWIKGDPHIEYLHQLQNYVFANTNTELNYQP